MTEDKFTKVTHESWISRIGNALKGILVGLVLFVIAFPLLFWNEGRSVKRYKTLKEGAGSVISVSSEGVEKANEGKLIHMAGKADTDAVLTDSVFGVSAKALRLKRIVEMYQWEETAQSKSSTKTGGGTETVTTYTYKTAWSDKAVSSANFQESSTHRNPGAIPYESKQMAARNVTLGAYRLSSSLVNMIDNFHSLPAGSHSALPAGVRGKVKVFDGRFYFGVDPESPQVGDIQVKFQVAEPGEVSVMAGQVDNSFEPYRTKAGGTIELLQTGVHSAEAMIQNAQDGNRLLTWGLRLLGFIAMLVGLVLILKPLSVLADVLPILGNIVGAGTGIISFLLAAVLSLITIAIAWIVYRPVLGILLLAISAGLTAGITAKLKSAKKTA